MNSITIDPVDRRVVAVGFNRFPLNRIVAVRGYISKRIVRNSNDGLAHVSMDYQPSNPITGLVITIYLDTAGERNEFDLCLEEAEEFLAKYDEMTGVVAANKAMIVEHNEEHDDEYLNT